MKHRSGNPALTQPSLKPMKPHWANPTRTRPRPEPQSRQARASNSSAVRSNPPRTPPAPAPAAPAPIKGGEPTEASEAEHRRKAADEEHDANPKPTPELQSQ